mmetsp:Transcript_68524/g.176660  ORF Transcript_68524/g.176660 Transcript_68524/m.176660 type:complete len:106 (-) Transcript_68524:41-358(-)
MALYPGHGAAVPSHLAEDYLRAQLKSLRQRENAIAEFLQGLDLECTLDDICRGLYGHGTEAAMVQDMVQQHLDAMVAQGRIQETKGCLFANTYGPPQPREASATA